MLCLESIYFLWKTAWLLCVTEYDLWAFLGCGSSTFLSFMCCFYLLSDSYFKKKPKQLEYQIIENQHQVVTVRTPIIVG